MLTKILIIFFFIVQVKTQKQDFSSTLIKIHLKSRILEFFRNDSLLFSFPIRIGADTTPTPLGYGYIYIKRFRPIFRYLDPGPKQGQIVDSAECSKGKVKVNYKKMRSLGMHYTKMKINPDLLKKLRKRGLGWPRSYSIHSVTCKETIGQAVSHGCIGLKISDMLKLYPYVKADIKGKNATKFVILDD